MPQINPEEIDQYKNNLNGEWFQLKNHGDVARIQFMMETYADLPVFVCHKVKIGEKDRYVNCLRHYNDPIDNCPLCAAGLKAQPVSFVVMYDHEDEKVKIWERGKEFLARLQGLCNRYSPICDYVFEIERNGKAGDKKTTYNIFTMDQVAPFDLSETEPPEFLGGLILEKVPEEMDEYLRTGNFPETEDSATAQTPEMNRRTPATPQGSTRATRAVGATPPSTTSRASAAAPNSAAPASRASRAPGGGMPRRGETPPVSGSERY